MQLSCIIITLCDNIVRNKREFLAMLRRIELLLAFYSLNVAPIAMDFDMPLDLHVHLVIL